jgi:hypothetical protein
VSPVVWIIMAYRAPIGKEPNKHLILCAFGCFIPHSFFPSPAGVASNDSRVFPAGEGSIEKRGLRPFSNSFPLLNQVDHRAISAVLFERGIKGVCRLEPPNANRTPGAAADGRRPFGRFDIYKIFTRYI